MFEEAINLLDKYYTVFDNFERVIDPNHNRSYRGRDIARAGFGSFLFYLAAADGIVTEEECTLIKRLLFWDLNPREVMNLISEKGIHKSEFYKNAPMVLKYAVKIDKKLHPEVQDSLSMITLSTFDMLGKLMIIADNNATMNEYTAFDRYMKMLIEYVEDNFDDEGKYAIPYYLISSYDPNHDDYGPGGTPAESYTYNENSAVVETVASPITTQEAAAEEEEFSYDETAAGEDYASLLNSPAEEVVLQTPAKASKPAVPSPKIKKSTVKRDEEAVGIVMPLGGNPTPVNSSFEEATPQFSQAFSKILQGMGNNNSKAVPKSPDNENPVTQLLGELEGLIGLKNVKEDVRSLINLVKIMKMREKRGMKKIPVSLHLVFSGNPGTGKTTVARLLAKIYQKIGVLSTGQLVEVDRSGLVAGYVGQTAAKTSAVIQKAMGGVLFIDEAYSLTNNTAKEDFGQEAVDTILKAMEDNRDNFVVIVAGYPKLMEDFVNSNPGLKSRFNKYLTFEDYTPEELRDIFAKLCKDNQYTANQAVMDYVYQYFSEQYANRDENFANGREVRNFFEKVISNQANRLASKFDTTEAELTELILEDVQGTYKSEILSSGDDFATTAFEDPEMISLLQVKEPIAEPEKTLNNAYAAAPTHTFPFEKSINETEELHTSTFNKENPRVSQPEKPQRETVKTPHYVPQRFVKVRFEDGTLVNDGYSCRPKVQEFDYLCDIPDIKPSDRVIVPIGDSLKEAVVVGVSYRCFSEMPLPAFRYKKVTSKCTAKNTKLQRYAKVQFPEGGKYYTYLCDIDDIEEGDLVRVKAQGEEKTAKVMELSYHSDRDVRAQILRYANHPEELEWEKVIEKKHLPAYRYDEDDDFDEAEDEDEDDCSVNFDTSNKVNYDQDGNPFTQQDLDDGFIPDGELSLDLFRSAKNLVKDPYHITDEEILNSLGKVFSAFNPKI